MHLTVSARFLISSARDPHHGEMYRLTLPMKGWVPALSFLSGWNHCSSLEGESMARALNNWGFIQNILSILRLLHSASQDVIRLIVSNVILF